MTTTRWHILTGEYPPQPGGVSDYTRMVARGLADAGDDVDVWAPAGAGAEPTVATADGVTVHRLPGRFGRRARRMLGEQLDTLGAPQRLLVQYVPHAFGMKGANVPLCAWLRSRHRDAIWVMFHEVAFPYDRHAPLAHNGLAAVNRAMASLVSRAAERIFVSIQAWVPDVAAMARPGTPVSWLPVPSSIPALPVNGATADIRARHGRGRPLVGHFGTYGGHIRPLLDRSVTMLGARADCTVLLMGRHSEAVRAALVARDPGIADRVDAVGELSPADLSRHVSACDVMLQPYPDGISTRRTSAMVALSHARPVVTTAGPLTEAMWRDAGAVLLVPVGDGDDLAPATETLLADPARRAELSARGREMYDGRFALRHTIDALRRPLESPTS